MTTNSVRGVTKETHTKSNPSKRHRERLNQELDRLASLLPYEQSVLSKLDKLSILRLSVSFLRTKSYFKAALSPQLSLEAGLNGPTNNHNHKHNTNHNHNNNVGAKQAAHYGTQMQLQNHHLHQNHQPNSLTSQGNNNNNNKIQAQQTNYPNELRVEGDLIVQALNGFLLILTCDGEVFYTSHTVETYLGFHQSDICHQSVYELVHSEDRDELTQQLKWNSMLLESMRSTSDDNMKPTLEQILASPEQRHLLERNFTVRFRCLLDNTSGFLRLDIRGRIKVLHGQQNEQNLANSVVNNNNNNHNNNNSNGLLPTSTPNSNGQLAKRSQDSPPAPTLAFFGVCIPFGPPSLLEMPTKESNFKSKHRLDMSLISIDSRGKHILGLTDLSVGSLRGHNANNNNNNNATQQLNSTDRKGSMGSINNNHNDNDTKPTTNPPPSTPTPGSTAASQASSTTSSTNNNITSSHNNNKASQSTTNNQGTNNNISAYDLVHQDDLSYMAAAHQELLKTGASGLIAYRVVTQPDGELQWLQTSAKLNYKNSKPDFIECLHRPLIEEEGRDLLGKRTMDFKVTYLDVGFANSTTANSASLRTPYANHDRCNSTKHNHLASSCDPLDIEANYHHSSKVSSMKDNLALDHGPSEHADLLSTSKANNPSNKKKRSLKEAHHTYNNSNSNNHASSTRSSSFSSSDLTSPIDSHHTHQVHSAISTGHPNNQSFQFDGQQYQLDQAQGHHSHHLQSGAGIFYDLDASGAARVSKSLTTPNQHQQASDLRSSSKSSKLASSKSSKKQTISQKHSHHHHHHHQAARQHSNYVHSNTTKQAPISGVTSDLLLLETVEHQQQAASLVATAKQQNNQLATPTADPDPQNYVMQHYAAAAAAVNNHNISHINSNNNSTQSQHHNNNQHQHNNHQHQQISHSNQQHLQLAGASTNTSNYSSTQHHGEQMDNLYQHHGYRASNGSSEALETSASYPAIQAAAVYAAAHHQSQHSVSSSSHTNNLQYNHHQHPHQHPLASHYQYNGATTDGVDQHGIGQQASSHSYQQYNTNHHQFSGHHQAAAAAAGQNNSHQSGSSSTAASAYSQGTSAFGLPAEQLLHHYSQSAAAVRNVALAAWQQPTMSDHYHHHHIHHQQQATSYSELAAVALSASGELAAAANGRLSDCNQTSPSVRSSDSTSYLDAVHQQQQQQTLVGKEPNNQTNAGYSTGTQESLSTQEAESAKLGVYVATQRNSTRSGTNANSTTSTSKAPASLDSDGGVAHRSPLSSDSSNGSASTTSMTTQNVLTITGINQQASTGESTIVTSPIDYYGGGSAPASTAATTTATTTSTGSASSELLLQQQHQLTATTNHHQQEQQLGGSSASRHGSSLGAGSSYAAVAYAHRSPYVAAVAAHHYAESAHPAYVAHHHQQQQQQQPHQHHHHGASAYPTSAVAAAAVAHHAHAQAQAHAHVHHAHNHGQSHSHQQQLHSQYSQHHNHHSHHHHNQVSDTDHQAATAAAAAAAAAAASYFQHPATDMSAATAAAAAANHTSSAAMRSIYGGTTNDSAVGCHPDQSYHQDQAQHYWPALWRPENMMQVDTKPRHHEQQEYLWGSGAPMTGCGSIDERQRSYNEQPEEGDSYSNRTTLAPPHDINHSNYDGYNPTLTLLTSARECNGQIQNNERTIIASKGSGEHNHDPTGERTIEQTDNSNHLDCIDDQSGDALTQLISSTIGDITLYADRTSSLAASEIGIKDQEK